MGGPAPLKWVKDEPSALHALTPPPPRRFTAYCASGIERRMSESPGSVTVTTVVRNILPQAVPKVMLSATTRARH